MHSSLIGKVEKANRYARELDRITIDRLSLTFRGDNDTHHVGLDAGQWHCTCHYFESWGSCVHLLTLQKIFGVMLPEEAQVSIFAAAEPVTGLTAAAPASRARRQRSSQRSQATHRAARRVERPAARRPSPVRAPVVDGRLTDAVLRGPGHDEALTGRVEREADRRRRSRRRGDRGDREPSPASQPAVSRTTTGSPWAAIVAMRLPSPEAASSRSPLGPSVTSPVVVSTIAASGPRHRPSRPPGDRARSRRAGPPRRRDRSRSRTPMPRSDR